MKIEHGTITELLAAQSELNVKYKGVYWRNELKKDEVMKAIFTEIAEFLESSPEDWKYWKKDKNDRQNQHIEVIDVLHFALTYYMLFPNQEDVPEVLEIEVDKENTLIDVISKFEKTPSIENLFKLVYFLCLSTKKELKFENILCGYFEKNKLNAHRVENGYLDGTYKKVDDNGDEDNRQIKFEED